MSLFKGTPAINNFTKVSELNNISYKYTELAPLKTAKVKEKSSFIKKLKKYRAFIYHHPIHSKE